MQHPELDRNDPPEARENPVDSSPREKASGRDRDGRHSLNRDELRTLKTVGAFRTINAKDLPGERLDRLIASRLLSRKTVYRSRGREPMDVLVLTKEGARALVSELAPGERQRFHAGLVKPNELDHDAAIYPAYLREAERIQKAGGTVRRVVLDYEFKSIINRETNRLDGPEREARRAQLARDLELELVDGKLPLPDLRVEYTDELGDPQHRDLEIVTKHYRGAHLAGKSATGFHLVNKDGPRSAVTDDHRMGFL